MQTDVPHSGSKSANLQELCVVVLGASGDLALQRILPALYTLWSLGTVPARLTIVGVALTRLTQDEYRQLALNAILAKGEPGFAADPGLSPADFVGRLHFLTGDLQDSTVYRQLESSYLGRSRQNALFYFACSPQLFGIAAEKLAQNGLAGMDSQAQGFRRLMIEKPFGTNLQAARELNSLLHRYYHEADLFRVDHYLGKDAVQNLIYFRFTNTIFEPLWNRKYIDRIEIVLAENEGIGRRGSYYDQAGAARDMLQNHLLQLFCLSAIERPANLSAAALREEKVKLLRSSRIPQHSRELPAFVRGQYGTAGLPGIADGRAYRQEMLVHPQSTTETYVALKLYVDNWRWQGVPFILRSGKALSQRYGEISIHFRQCPIDFPGAARGANRLILRIQPEEGVSMRFNTRAPGGAEREQEELVGTLRDSASAAPGPYERLLADALHGDNTLFIRFDETEEAWRLIDPMLSSWDQPGFCALQEYTSGSRGPDISCLYRNHPAWQQNSVIA
ncbi:MAG: glucose-6-phosphate dehydrogenase [Spirochaetes bacterium]|nr:glucose-6-phosphate dehydrogenase [Spirochaetota bacterium]